MWTGEISQWQRRCGSHRFRDDIAGNDDICGGDCLAPIQWRDKVGKRAILGLDDAGRFDLSSLFTRQGHKWSELLVVKLAERIMKYVVITVFTSMAKLSRTTRGERVRGHSRPKSWSWTSGSRVEKDRKYFLNIDCQKKRKKV